VGLYSFIAGLFSFIVCARVCVRACACACACVCLCIYLCVREREYEYVFVCERERVYVYYLCERVCDCALTPNILLPDDPPAQGSYDPQQLFTCMHLCGFTAAYDEGCVCSVYVCVNMHTH
jgi:hypothetical protein